MRRWLSLLIAAAMPASLIGDTAEAVDQGGAFIWGKTRELRAPGSQLKTAEALEFTGYALKPPEGQGWRVLRQGPHPLGVGFAKQGKDRMSLVWAGSFLLALESSTKSIVKGLVGQPYWREDARFEVLTASGREVVLDKVRCVRVTSTAQKASKKRVSRIDTELKAECLSCTHPSAPAYQLVLGFVERKPLKSEWTTDVSEAERFFESLQFKGLETPIESNLALPGPPFALTDLSGALWVGLGNEGVLLRIDPDSGDILNSIELPEPASSLASLDDSLWMVTSKDGRVFRFSPDTERVEKEIEVPQRCRKVVAGAGSCWVICGRDQLVRIDPRTNTIQATITGSWPGKKGPLKQSSAVLTGVVYAEPWLWVADGEHGLVFRVDATNNQIHDTAIKVGERPVEIVATESSVWTVNRAGVSVSHIDQQSGKVLAEVTVDWEPVFGIAHEGILWLSNSSYHAVSRVDTTQSVSQVKSLGVGLRPMGLTVSGEYLWVADGWGDALHKIRLEHQAEAVP